MSEFWLISAPGQKTTQQTWESCKAKSEEFSMIYKFNLPDLKVSLFFVHCKKMLHLFHYGKKYIIPRFLL